MSLYISWCRHLLVSFLFHALTSLHPPSFYRNDFSTCISPSMYRRMMIEKIAAHIADFTPRLQSNTRATYQVHIQLCICHFHFHMSLARHFKFRDYLPNAQYKFTVCPTALLFRENGCSSDSLCVRISYFSFCHLITFSVCYL